LGKGCGVYEASGKQAWLPGKAVEPRAKMKAPEEFAGGVNASQAAA
jgi:hypothetical protein